MARKKLNYRFHNPNSVEATADYILKVFIEVNEKKVEEAIQKVGKNLNIEDECNDVEYFG